MRIAKFSIPTLCLASILFTGAVKAEIREIALSNIVSPLVPTAVLQGDREFDGNGPRIKSNVTLRISEDRRSLIADVYFHAKETKHDWSTTEGRWPVKVWDAPPGQRIRSEGILSSNFSEVEFTSVKAGFQILGPGGDFKQFADIIISAVGERVEGDTESEILDAIRRGVAMIPEGGNHVHIKQPDRGELVSLFFIVGDTGGPDISDDDNPKDDTRISQIAFNRVRVDLESAPIGETTDRDGGAGVVIAPLSDVGVISCPEQVQGKIAWDYKNSKVWNQRNVDRLCKGAGQSPEPANCFQRVMHGGINGGSGARWNWQDALDLCEGSLNANATVSCFGKEIQNGRSRTQAIEQCDERKARERGQVSRPAKRKVF